MRTTSSRVICCSGYYSIRIESAGPHGFRARAAPKAGGPPAGDPCVFVVDQDGPVIETEDDRRCWQRGR